MVLGIQGEISRCPGLDLGRVRVSLDQESRPQEACAAEGIGGAKALRQEAPW